MEKLLSILFVALLIIIGVPIAYYLLKFLLIMIVQGILYVFTVVVIALVIIFIANIFNKN